MGGFCEWNGQQAGRRYELNEEIEDWENAEIEDELDEEDEDKPLRSYIEQRDVIFLWRAIEHHRHEIAHQEARFRHWLQRSPELAKDWREFQSLGGVTADDFVKFCAGTMRHRLTRERKHLRMIVNRRNVIRRVRFDPGNDAA